MKPETFHQKLKKKMDEFVHLVYLLTRFFPKEELYGVTSQLRRAALSVVLNYIEGYARGRKKVHKNFLEISYGSLKECKYLLYFSFEEGFFKEDEYKKVLGREEMGGMLWGVISKLN